MPEMEEEDRREPLKHFAHLSEHTRRFLERLSHDDVACIEEVIRSFRKASTVGWFLKWLITAMVGSFVAVATFGNSIGTIAKWFHG